MSIAENFQKIFNYCYNHYELIKWQIMKNLIKKFIPEIALSAYHKTLAMLAAFVYGYPSEKMIIVGVTGTNGKSTTVEFIAKALAGGGFKVGSTSTVKFQIAGREWLNDKKMTMLGRFQLQKLLSRMFKAGCRYAVIETSSQGIEQFRHWGINYDYLVFTNLTPEHIEAHGGFENYKKAKGKLFKRTATLPRKTIDNKKIEKVGIYNADSEYAKYFASFVLDQKIYFSVKNCSEAVCAQDVKVGLDGCSFVYGGTKFHLPIMGAFNVENSLPAIIIAEREGIAMPQVAKAFAELESVPGRMELIQTDKLKVLVDYAHEPAGMEKLYETVNLLKNNQEMPINKIIHVLGSGGGGRDVARRPVLGKIVAKNADMVIVTNEDPYDDDPWRIIEQVAEGAENAGKIKEKNLFCIMDRAEAIRRAMDLADVDDLVMITGKGAEQAMAVAGGKYIPWDDRRIVKEYIKKNKETEL